MVYCDSNWTWEASVEESLKIIDAIAIQCFKSAGPRFKHLGTLVKEKKYGELVAYDLSYEVEPFCGPLRPQEVPLIVRDYSFARQGLAFYSKNPILDLGIDRRKVSFDKFMACEALNKESNDIFLKHRYGSFSFEPIVESVLFTAQRKIADILGEVPRLSELKCSFGPGSNTSCSRHTSARWKLGAPLQCSSNMIGVKNDVLSEFPLMVLNHTDWEMRIPDVGISPGKLTFVPKSAKTDRAIVIEPLLNTLVQKGIGKYLKRRLRLAGCNLRDQSRNQGLAKEGSQTGRLATIDLSSASDTVSYGIVSHLLPIDWFDFLNQFRTSTVRYRKKIIHQEKFSSMGNAFTFELESLIFLALARGCCEVLRMSTDQVSVYGDDIIVPVGAYPLLAKVLGACGFIPNKGKTFASGEFRESCGADYLMGFDIRPVYLDEGISGRVLFAIHNGLVRRGKTHLANLVLSYIHPSLIQWGPDGYGDGHLIGAHYGYQSLKARKRGWYGTSFDTFAMKPLRFKGRTRGDWILPAYTIYVSDVDDDRATPLMEESEPVDHFVVRGFNGYKRLSIYTLAS